jgi:hypothetical protein
MRRDLTRPALLLSLVCCVSDSVCSSIRNNNIAMDSRRRMIEERSTLFAQGWLLPSLRWCSGDDDGCVGALLISLGRVQRYGQVDCSLRVGSFLLCSFCVFVCSSFVFSVSLFYFSFEEQSTRRSGGKPTSGCMRGHQFVRRMPCSSSSRFILQYNSYVFTVSEA